MAYTLPWWPLTLAMTLSHAHNPCINTLCTNPWPLHQPGPTLDICVNPCTNPLTLAPTLDLAFYARLWSVVGYWKGPLQGFDAQCMTARVPYKDLTHGASLQRFSARIWCTAHHCKGSVQGLMIGARVKGQGLVEGWMVGAHINRISVKKDRKTSKNIKIWPFLTWFWLVQGSRVKGWCTHYHRIRVKKDRKPSKNIKIWPFLTIVQSLVLCNHFPTSIYSQVTHFPHTHVIP
jgi:hypothetical protein